MFHLRVRQFALVVLVGLVVGPLALAPRVAASIPLSPLDLTHPQVTRQLSAELAKAPPSGLKLAAPGKVLPLVRRAATAGPQREVFGFGQGSVRDDPGVGYPSWDFSMLTTVAYFAVHVNWDGHLIKNDTAYAIWNSSRLTNLVNAAHSNGVKVVMTLVLFDGSLAQDMMCSGLGWGGVTISEAVPEIAAQGADGINIDYDGQNVPCPANGHAAQLMLIV